MPQHRYPTLFSPISIGTMRLRNRVVAAPIDTKMGSSEGEITHRHIAFARERARNGVGAIIVDNAAVEWPRGKSGGTPIRLDHDRFVVGLGELVDEVHTWGAAVVCQINHVGRQSSLRATGGIPLISASDVPWKGSGTVPVAATREDIAGLIDNYAQAARRVKQAGCDGVEVHACHGYLLSSFLSPFTNTRDDEYGGSLENRARIVIEAITAVREQVGPEFPVLVRINGADYVENGLDVQDAAAVAALLEAAGADAIDVTAGMYESRPHTFPGVDREEGAHARLSAAVRQAVGVPVVTVGKIKTPEAAERLLADGQADLVAIARALIADPGWASKAHAGRAETIRPCIYTNRCRFRIQQGLRMACDVNPDVGREPDGGRPLTHERIVVVGGGPAGLEAAMRFAERGAQVTLCEREDELGGQLRLAARVGYKGDLADYLRYLVAAAERSEVKLAMGEDTTTAVLEALAPDVVVLATGARPLGGPGENPAALTGHAVLAGAPVSGTVSIVGAGPTGCEVAAALALRGHDVTLLEQREEVGGDITVDLLDHLKGIFAEQGVRVRTGCRVDAIEGGRLVLADGSEHAADTVVAATGVASDTTLLAAIADRWPTLLIGDARTPGSLLSCTGDAARVVASFDSPAADPLLLKGRHA